MAGDLVEYRPRDAAGNLVQWAEAAEAAFRLADSIVRTNVCPPAFRGKPQEATAVILLGAELGLSPITSLRAMYDIRGQLGMYVRAQVALVQAHGHRIWTENETPDAVTVAGHRAGDPEHVERVTWSIARARQAGFIRRGARNEPSQYETQPITMLWARAAGDVARRIAADVLAGIPEVDEPAADASQPGDASTTSTTTPRVIQRAPLPAPPTAQDDPARASESPGDAHAGPTDNVPPPVELDDDNEPDEPNDDAEPTLSRGQLQRLQVVFVQAGIRGPDARHAYLTKFLGRPIESTNDLTVTEASAAIDDLEAEARQDRPWRGGTDDE